MTASALQRGSRHPPPGPAPRSLGIDVVKGLAILGVIAQHVVLGDAKRRIGGPLWFEQAVPVFVVLFGFNSARSASRSGLTTLRALYGRAQLGARARRLLLPAAVAWAIVAIVGALQGRLRFGALQVIGAAPIVGGAPGDYFVTLVLGLALVFPAVWWAYLRRPMPTLLALVAVAVVWELVARPLLATRGYQSYFAVANPFRFAAAVAAGLWLASEPGLRRALQARRRAIGVAAALSAVFLLAVTLAPDGRGREGFGVLYPGFSVSTGVWALGWTVLITIVLVDAVDRLAEGARAALAPLAVLGRASYHVFLAQAAVLGLWRTRDVGLLALEVAASLAVGWLAWRLTEGRTTARTGSRPAPATA